MNRALVCSVCGGREGDGVDHENVRCGTWGQLVAEIERLHRLNPNIENTLRTAIALADLFDTKDGGDIYPW